MKISTWRPKLKTWFQKYVTVSNWEMDNPIAPSESIGVLPPLTNVRLYKANNSVMGSATQVIDLITRIDGTMKYDNLPLSYFEGIYTTVAYRMLTEFADIADVFQLQHIESNPIAVSERDDARGDWFIRVQWMFNLQWLAEVETGTVGSPYNITKVLVGLNRGLVPKEPADLAKPVRYTLDTRLQVNL
jgi:hypothetical protein